MSRGNDNALGPCVDERAAMANALQPNAIVSIHADGGPATGRGFHVNYSTPPLNEAQAGPVGAVRPDHARPAGRLRASRPPTTSAPTGSTGARTWPG